MENLIYTWKFSDKKHRSKLWYTLAVAVVIGLSVWGVLTGQYGLSFVVMLAAGVLFFVENNSPDEIDVVLNDLGIMVDESFYEYSKIQSFSYVFVKELPIQLELLVNKKGLKTIRLPIDKTIYSDLQTILPTFLEEGENMELTVSEKLINLLKL